MVKVTFQDFSKIEDCEFKFAVICAKYKEKWIFCKHKERTTWEIPGGHRELDETIEETAKRELIEETGATKFDIHTISAYCVENGNEKTYGILFFADIEVLGNLSVNSEIGETKLFDSLPKELTYPMIQPYLFDYALKRSKHHD